MNDFFGQVLSQEQQRGIELERILMPHARKQRDEFFGQNKRFVHYTSADAAIKIIKSKRLWMRNTTCMSDYREVQHGFEMLLRFFSDEDKKKRFVQALDACFPGAANEAINLFDQYWNDTRSNTYIASIRDKLFCILPMLSRLSKNCLEKFRELKVCGHHRMRTCGSRL
jgi:hypothetical protein